MSSGERQRRDDRPAANGAGTGPGGEGLDALADRVDAVIAAGDRAIRKALSRDSDEFLRRGRQQGGQ